MVQVRLTGGLGNQLFQYAAALALAKKNNCDLYLDTGFYDNSKNRKYELFNFNISSKHNTNRLLTKFYNAFRIRFLNKKNVPFENYPIYKELNFSYDKSFLNQEAPLILDGYWQSEKYFNSVSELIKNEFQFINKLKYEDLSILKEIKNCNSISLHFRHGDYKNNKLIEEIHGVLPEDYYIQAIEKLKSKIKIDQIYIFSDDIEYADSFILKHKLGINVSSLMNDSLIDFYLLQNCKHNIIANSSFSWWSAWLNTNPEKIVIAPKSWFKDATKDTSDLYPKDWILI